MSKMGEVFYNSLTYEQQQLFDTGQLFYIFSEDEILKQIYKLEYTENLKSKIEKTTLDMKHVNLYNQAWEHFNLVHKNTNETDYVFFLYMLTKEDAELELSQNKKQKKAYPTKQFSYLKQDITKTILSKIVEYSLINHYNTYLAFASFEDKLSRKEANLSSFQSLTIDFDYYKNENFKHLTAEEFLHSNEIQGILKKCNITPYCYMFSGRGAYLIFRFTELQQNLTKEQKILHKKVFGTLLQEFATLGENVVDSLPKDFSRFFRLAGSIHTKSNQHPKILEITGMEMDYSSFIQNLVDNLNIDRKEPDEKQTNKSNTKEKATMNSSKKDSEKVIVDFMPKENNTKILNLVYQLPEEKRKEFYNSILEEFRDTNICRVKDMEHLVELRQGRIEYRNNLLLNYGIQLFFTIHSNTEHYNKDIYYVKAKMLEMNSKFKEKYSPEEVTRIFQYIKSNEDNYQKGNFRNMYYPSSTKNLISKQFITLEEQKQLIVLNETKKRFGKRFEVLNRSFKRLKKAVRDEKIQKQLEEKESIDIIASENDVSEKTVYNKMKTSKKEQKKIENKEIIRLKKENKTNKEIAEYLHISLRTLKSRINKLSKESLL